MLRSEAPLASILDLAEDAIICTSGDQRIVFFNEGARRIFGYEPEEILGQPISRLIPERFREAHGDHITRFAQAPESSRRMAERTGGIAGRRKDGSEFPAEASISKAAGDDQTYFTVILRDVTERRAAERAIVESLQEKDLLLREIHHRVKNNLQIVSSLLGLQARTFENEAFRRAFEDSKNRVQSMSLLHEMLYKQVEKLAEIDCQEYVGQLTSHLFRSYGVSTSRVQLKLSIEISHMTMDVAVPCGLILNELVSNALKHAFPEGREGNVHIMLRRGADARAVLRVEDNGIGLPNDASLWSSRSLGLRLVRILAERLGATVEVKSERGTEITLILPEITTAATA